MSEKKVLVRCQSHYREATLSEGEIYMSAARVVHLWPINRGIYQALQAYSRGETCPGQSKFEKHPVLESLSEEYSLDGVLYKYRLRDNLGEVHILVPPDRRK